MRITTAVLCVASMITVGASIQAAEPTGWILRGSHPEQYEIGTDTATFHGGKASGFIRSKGDKAEAFGTLMQSFRPGGFAGARVRLSGYIKTHAVTGKSAMWMRTEGASNGAFDNMLDRKVPMAISGRR